MQPAAVSSGRRLALVVYDLLKERLLDGEFQAGERLSVESLKAEFGVSKQPVMDALRRLATAGLVEIIPQVGSRVPVYSAADVSDFFTIFGGMEGAVAGVAAQRCTDREIETLAAVNDEISELVAHPDMAHSPVVADLSHRMWDMSDLLINTSGIRQPLASAVSGRRDDHEQIISALRGRDQAAARSAMERHIVGRWRSSTPRPAPPADQQPQPRRTADTASGCSGR